MTTLSITSLNVMTFTIMDLILIFNINYSQHDDTQHNITERQNNGFNFDIQYK
jgi:hypothetical protein